MDQSAPGAAGFAWANERVLCVFSGCVSGFCACATVEAARGAKGCGKPDLLRDGLLHGHRNQPEAIPASDGVGERVSVEGKRGEGLGWGEGLCVCVCVCVCVCGTHIKRAN